MGDALRLAFLGGTQNLDGFLRSEGIGQVAEVESRNELFGLHLGKELAIAGGAVGHTATRVFLVKSVFRVSSLIFFGFEVVTFSWTSRPGGEPPPYGEVQQGAA